MIASASQRKKAARQEREGRIKANVAARREAERFAHVSTFTTAQGEVRVSHREPAMDELFQIQKARNQDAQHPRSPEERLHSIQNELKSRHRIQRFNALEIGRLYYEAKQILGYGEFGEWRDRLGLHGKSAVHYYMNVYLLCCGRPELVESIPPTKLQIICQPNFPAELRETIFSRGGINGTVEQLKEVAEKCRTGETDADSAEVERLLAELDGEATANAVNAICWALENRAETAKAELTKLLYQSAPANRPSIQHQIDAIDQFIRAIGAGKGIQ